MVDEQRLLERARDFDLDALAEVYDRFSPGIYRYAMRLMGDPDQAEDCVADTFDRFLVALRNGGGPQDHLQAYLYRIAHNWVTDQYRRGPAPTLALDEELAGEGDNPAQSGDAIQQGRLRAALRCLTPDQRQVLALKFLEGWENEAVAALMGKPVGAIKALQHRGLGALRRMLQPERED